MHEPPQLYPPLLFGVIDTGIYRSAIPTSLNIPFLKSIGINTIISLNVDETVNRSNDHVNKNYVGSFNDEYYNNINLINIKCSSPVAEESVVDALRIIIDLSHRPVLIVCQTGRNINGLNYCIYCLQNYRKIMS